MFVRRPAAIVDVDGTLVDVSGIRHHVIPVDENGNYKSRNFDAFHRDAIDCPPIHDTIKKVKSWHEDEGLDILIVTARSQRYGRMTAFWLAMYDVPSTVMIMRREGDMRKDYLVKRDILRHNILPEWIPLKAADDNPHVVTLWEEFHIPEIHVVPGYTE